MDLKYGDKTRTMIEANNNYQGAKRMRKKLTKIQDTESEINAQYWFWFRVIWIID